MHVVATAGHVDHGKSTLVRALTGMEPDRWAEERRRGMTIDLGYAWTTLADGTELAFVDVPGHQRFVANMLAGVGPIPAVMLVIAADEGWSRQTGEHLAALAALGVRHGVLAVTRSDLGDAELAIEEARDYLSGTSLSGLEAVAVSPVAGTGLAELRDALMRMAAAMPAPPAAPPRLWIDRVFTIRGAGTVITGTLATGSICAGDELRLAPGHELVRVRGLQSLKQEVARAEAVARVAVNLRGVKADEVQRGDALVAVDSWADAEVVDVRLVNADAALPTELFLHLGSAAVPVRLRRLGSEVARLRLRTPLPLRVADRGVLRDPGHQHIAAGVLILDVAPPVLTRRGAAAARGRELAALTGRPDPAADIKRRGAARRSDLVIAGVMGGDTPVPVDTVVLGDWLVHPGRWSAWRADLDAAVRAWGADHPLSPSMPREAASRAVGLPDAALLGPLVAEVESLTLGRDGVCLVGARVSFPPEVGHALDELVASLVEAPFSPPDGAELAAAGLTEQHLAAAARQGMLIRLAAGVYLLPDSVEAAADILGELPQPFTLSQARVALATTRRVAVPLLELLDRTHRTRRIDEVLRILL